MITEVIRKIKEKSVLKKIAFLALLPMFTFGLPYAARYILAFCWFHNREAWLYVFVIMSKIATLGVLPLLFYTYQKNAKPMNRIDFWGATVAITIISVIYSIVSFSNISEPYSDMNSFIDKYLRSAIGDFIDIIVVLYLFTLFIVIKFSKKSLLLLSVYASAFIVEAIFFPIAVNKCGYATCIFNSDFFKFTFLLIALVAFFTAVFYFLNTSTLKKWLKFSIFYIPITTLLYAISPVDDGGWLSISTADTVGVLALFGFIAVTITLILYRSYKMSGKEFMRAVASLSIAATVCYFIALKNHMV